MTTHSPRDDDFMRRVMRLAHKFAGRTSPNPMVGCVIVDKRGTVIAEGAHKGPGHDHAEIAALRKLGGKAPGATIYVNMEPCTHRRAGKTPCAVAVKASGAARLVVGSEDPYPGHGGGIAAVRRAGISVTRALVEECDRFNRGFLVWASANRPAFTLKAAITLDGKIATVAGSSKWITGERARLDGHAMRNDHDAIMVGIGTVLKDDPRLDCRIVGGRDPIRIVLDGQLRTPPAARLLPKKTGPRTIIVTGLRADHAKQAALEKAGAEVMRMKLRANGQVPIYELARDLALQRSCRCWSKAAARSTRRSWPSVSPTTSSSTSPRRWSAARRRAGSAARASARSPRRSRCDRSARRSTSTTTSACGLFRYR